MNSIVKAILVLLIFVFFWYFWDKRELADKITHLFDKIKVEAIYNERFMEGDSNS